MKHRRKINDGRKAPEVKNPGVNCSFMKKLSCAVYVISTPKRERMVREGPPHSAYHVREWTFHEFQVPARWQNMLLSLFLLLLLLLLLVVVVVVFFKQF
jgi:hypothetical protein